MFTHLKLTNRLESAAETMFCQNEACPLSRTRVVQTDTLADIRRAERRERDEKERIAKEQKDRAAKAAAKKALIEAALVPMRKDWHWYVRNRISYGTPVEQIMNFDRWQQIGDSARIRIMELVRESESQLSV